jgi:hypothetical protein
MREEAKADAKRALQAVTKLVHVSAVNDTMLRVFSVQMLACLGARP